MHSLHRSTRLLLVTALAVIGLLCWFGYQQYRSNSSGASNVGIADECVELWTDSYGSSLTSAGANETYSYTLSVKGDSSLPADCYGTWHVSIATPAQPPSTYPGATVTPAGSPSPSASPTGNPLNWRVTANNSLSPGVTKSGTSFDVTLSQSGPTSWTFSWQVKSPGVLPAGAYPIDFTAKSTNGTSGVGSVGDTKYYTIANYGASVPALPNCPVSYSDAGGKVTAALVPPVIKTMSLNATVRWNLTVTNTSPRYCPSLIPFFSYDYKGAVLSSSGSAIDASSDTMMKSGWANYFSLTSQKTSGDKWYVDAGKTAPFQILGTYTSRIPFQSSEISWGVRVSRSGVSTGVLPAPNFVITGKVNGTTPSPSPRATPTPTPTPSGSPSPR